MKAVAHLHPRRAVVRQYRDAMQIVPLIAGGLVLSEAWKFFQRRRPERAEAGAAPAAELATKRPTRPVASGG